MELQKIYKAFAKEKYGYCLKNKPIANVEFNHSIGEGSWDINDSDFSTFAGSEIWSISIDYEDGDYDSVSLYDSNPVYDIVKFCESKNIIIEFPEEPSLESILDHHIRN